MNPISHLNQIEQAICNKADLYQIPIAGNIELLPLCNMNCEMCFAKMTKKQMEAHAPMHTWKEWLDVIKEMSDAGMIFLLLTGGEPFLYPNFMKLYHAIRKMGIIVSINTNGTLINEKIANSLAIDPPRRLNITLYGASNETYNKLCHNPQGLTQVLNGIKLLKDRNIDIKLNCSLTPLNIDEQEKIFHLAEELELPIEMGFYMFPPTRQNNVDNVKNRLSAKQAAQARFTYEKLKRTPSEMKAYVLTALDTYYKYSQNKNYKKGYTCRSGNSVFWVNYDGTMSACSFTNDFQIDIFKNSFEKSWKQLKSHISMACLSVKCHNCKERILCGRCAAAAYAETGKISGTPEYYCELTKHYIYLLEKYKEKEK